jgi:hypothetical protein
MAIPEIFRPTPLQYMSMNHPIIIDFISWPSLRDQMILHRHSLDLDVLCRDLTLHTVVEIPEEGVAIGVYDYMQHQESLTRTPQSCLEDPNWTYVQIPIDSAFISSSDPAEDMILQELSIRMENRSLECPTISNKFLERTSHINNYCFTLTHDRSGPGTLIHQLRQWKLSKDFALKWPLLDCSTSKSSRRSEIKLT